MGVGGFDREKDQSGRVRPISFLPVPVVGERKVKGSDKVAENSEEGG